MMRTKLLFGVHDRQTGNHRHVWLDTCPTDSKPFALFAKHLGLVSTFFGKNDPTVVVAAGDAIGCHRRTLTRRRTFCSRNVLSVQYQRARLRLALDGDFH